METGEPSGGRPGRPRQWESTAAKHRAHRHRQGERLRLLEGLLHAVRNARWEEPELHRTLQEGDDLAVLAALTDYYRKRHWMTTPAKQPKSRG